MANKKNKPAEIDAGLLAIFKQGINRFGKPIIQDNLAGDPLDKIFCFDQRGSSKCIEIMAFLSSCIEDQFGCRLHLYESLTLTAIIMMLDRCQSAQ